MREFKIGKPTRQAYGEALLQLGMEDDRIVVLDGDLSKSTYTKYFAEKFPERFFNAGIAEANMVGMAAGLAASGKIPFVSSFACFMVNKTYEQIKISVCGSNLSVKFVASHGGISVGEDGFTQQSVEDIALMTSFPGFTVIVPADEVETKLAVRKAAYHPGSVYIRVGRPKAPIVYENGCPFEIGKANLLEDGEDLTIIAMGLLVAEALKAHDILRERGIKARVLDMHTVKPPDREAIEKAARETGAILVAEEHIAFGGLGSVVARVVGETYPVPMEFVNTDDSYGESGKPDQLFDKYGLSYRHIFDKALKLIERKR